LLPDIQHRQVVLSQQPSQRPDAGPKARFRESLDTLLLGALSTSIGVVLLIALAAVVAQRPIAGWNERAISPILYSVPSKDCAIMAVVGAYLGLAGILLAKHRHGTVSVLSIVGTVISLLYVCLFFLYVSLMELF
jgi:hypothetical protein